MPILPYLPAIGSGLGIIDNVVGRNSIKKQNERDRQFQLDMWNATNTYNSPASQMERLKAAGLNPNLVYGNGSATNTASNITPTASKPIPSAMVGSAINSYIDTQQKNLQNDLIASQIFNNGLLSEDIKTRADRNISAHYESLFRSRNIEVDTEMKQFEFSKQKELRQVSIDGQIQLAKKTMLQNKEAEINMLTLDKRNQQILLESYSRLKLMDSQLNNQQLDNAIKQEIKNLRQKGLNESDNVLLRLFSDLLPDKKDTGTFVKSYK